MKRKLFLNTNDCILKALKNIKKLLIFLKKQVSQLFAQDGRTIWKNKFRGLQLWMRCYTNRGGLPETITNGIILDNLSKDLFTQVTLLKITFTEKEIKTFN